MENNIEYYQITTTIDPKIIGRSELSLTVEVKDKDFLNFRKNNLTYINDYFAKKEAYEGFPKGISGKMYQKKKEPIDIMDLMPHCLGIEFIISEKVKQILEKLQIDRNEYHMEDLLIEGSDSKFYFLFIPILKDSDYIDFTKSIFWDDQAEKTHVFGTYESYKDDKINRFKAKELYISADLKQRDIIKLQSSRTQFSKRVIDAFQKETVIGYDLIEGGDFKVILKFKE